MRCYKEENGVTQKLNEYAMQQDKESRTVNLLGDQVRRLQEPLEFIEDSKFFYDPDAPSSYDSAYSTRFGWIMQWFKKFVDIIDDSEERNWENWERRAIAINTYILLFGESKTKHPDGGKCPMSLTNLAVGIATCTQGMTVPSYLSSEMHLPKFPDQTKFQS